MPNPSYCLTLYILPIGKDLAVMLCYVCYVSYRIKRCCMCWQRKFLIILSVVLWDCFWGELQRDFLEPYGLLDQSKPMPCGFQPTTWMRTFRSACQAKDLSLICYNGEDLLPWINELLSIQFSCNSGIPELACWHQSNEYQEMRNVLRGTRLLLWISYRDSLNSPLSVIYWSENLEW